MILINFPLHCKGYGSFRHELDTALWIKFYSTFFFHLQMKPDDVVLLTYPKCGTTWMQEVLWTMRNNPELDNPMAAAPVNARVAFLE